VSRHWPDSDELDRRLARAKIVYEFHPDDIGMLEYLRRNPLR